MNRRPLKTDPESVLRSPPSVKTPTGIIHEITSAWEGKLAYDPSCVHAPVAIIRGEWDRMCTDTDAKWLFDALLGSPMKRDVKISRATHLMHFGREPIRALSRGSNAFKRRRTLMSKSTFLHEAEASSVAGYDYGVAGVARSPVSLAELQQLEATVGWSTEDVKVLQRHGDLFRDKAEQMVDSWRAVIGARPHPAKWFVGSDGKPDDDYKTKIKKRFVQAWLDYQEEIGLRHTPDKKNRTDGAQTPSLVPLRFQFAFGTVVASTTRKFFVDAGIRDGELQKLQDAWSKAVQLHITLWSRPYAKAGLW